MESAPTSLIPPVVLAVGLKLFTNEKRLSEWLSHPAKWAQGKTPADLIAEGRTDEVVGAINGIGHGNFL